MTTSTTLWQFFKNKASVSQIQSFCWYVSSLNFNCLKHTLNKKCSIGGQRPYGSEAVHFLSHAKLKGLSAFNFARLMGADPTASPVHLSIIFIKAWTISSPIPQLNRGLGTLVSSLYGAPSLYLFFMKVKIWKGSHGIRMSCTFRKRTDFSLHRYPREFQSAISTESCISTGECSTVELQPQTHKLLKNRLFPF